MSEEMKSSAQFDMLPEGGGDKEGVYPAVRSSQVTRLVAPMAVPPRPVVFKFEWRIEQIERLIEQYPWGNCLPSKPFHFPQVSNGVLWQLDFYPNGRHEADNGHSSIFLSQMESMPTAKMPARLHLYFIMPDGSQLFIHKSMKCFESFDFDGSQRVPRDKLHSAMHSDGSVKVLCEGSFMVPPLAVETTILSMEERGVGESAVTAAVETSSTNQFADCSVKVGDKVLPAHSHFLQQQSKILHGMVKFQKKRTGGGPIVLSIHDSSVEAVTAMLEFIYTGSVSERALKESGHAILALAHHYSLTALNDYAVQHVPPMIDDGSVLRLYVCAHKFQIACLREACTSYFVEHSTPVMELQEWRELEDSHLKLAYDLLKEITIRCKKEAPPQSDSKKEQSSSPKRPRSPVEEVSSTAEHTNTGDGEEEDGPGSAKRSRSS